MREQRRNLKVRRPHGFTLVELLVVIAVISVLLAVLLPGLSRARRLAKRRVCQARLRQIAQAWQLYLNDNEGQFYQRINANITYGGWRGKNPSFKTVRRPLNRYLARDSNDLCSSPTDAEAFECSADNGGLDGGGMSFYMSTGTSYQTNVLLVGQNQKGWLPNDELLSEINLRLRNLTINAVSNPSRLLLIGDFGWANDWEPEVPRVGDWHGRCCCHNLAYVDGHIRFLRIRKGLYVTDDYTVLPFQELYALARDVQQEEPCQSQR